LIVDNGYQASIYPLLVFVVLAGFDAYIYNRNLLEVAAAAKIREEIDKLTDAFVRENLIPAFGTRKKKYKEIKNVIQGDGV
jgi:hypothetical protein